MYPSQVELGTLVDSVEPIQQEQEEEELKLTNEEIGRLKAGLYREIEELDREKEYQIKHKKEDDIKQEKKEQIQHKKEKENTKEKEDQIQKEKEELINQKKVNEKEDDDFLVLLWHPLTNNKSAHFSGKAYG